MELSEFEYDLIILKKYNDDLWIDISKYTLPILLAIYVYSILKPRDISKAVKYSDIQIGWNDIAVSVCTVYSLVYYVVDILCLVLSGLA